MSVAGLDPQLTRLVRDEDVVEGYRFFFGRDPESPDTVVAKSGSSRRDLLAQLVGAAEYDERLAAPVLAGSAPSGLLFSAPPPRTTLAWAANFFPLEDETRARLSQSSSWIAAHAVVLNDARMRAALPELAEHLPLDTLAGRLSDLSADLGRRAVAGDLEEATAQLVRGYLLDRNRPDEPQGVELWVDGRFVAAARADTYSRELQERFGGSGRYGFIFQGFSLPDSQEGRSLRIEVRESAAKLVFGAKVVAWRAVQEAHHLAALTEEVRQARRTLEKIETTLRLTSGALGFTLDRWDAYWRTYYIRTPALTLREAEEAQTSAWRPRFDVIVTGNARDTILLEPTLASIKAQVQSNFNIQVLLGDDVEALSLSGDYVVLVDAGDTLAPDALHRLALAGQGRPALIMVDSDTLDGVEHLAPVLRSGFDYDLLLQLPYIGSTAAVRVDALQAALAAGAGLAPDRRADLWLHVVEAGGVENVAHAARVLLHAAPRGLETPPHDYAQAIQRHLARLGSKASASPAFSATDDGAGLGPRLRIKWPLPRDVRVAVIVPTRDRLDLLGPCLASLTTSRSRDGSAAMEIIVVDNDSAEAVTQKSLQALSSSGGVRVLNYPDAFNWSAINNFAARATDADVLIFLNNDTVALTPDWCDELCAQALRPDVGAVGARLLYEDGSIQHAGVILGTAQAIAAHEGAGAPAAEEGYLGRRKLVHRAAAVTGACLATRREVFTRLGGFDEARLAIEANDIDYCLRVRHAGLTVLYDPWATLYHFESRSRGHTGFDDGRRRKADEELAAFERRWGDAARSDPYYNGHFDRLSRPFLRLGPPPDA